MYKKHSIAERLQAVQKCLDGQAPCSVGREMGINDHYISEWLLRYQQEGIVGLQKRPMKRANFEEKCKIICEYAEKGVSLHRVSVKYHVAQCTISKWAQLYRQGGYEALRVIKPQGTGRKGMGRPKKKEPQTEVERMRNEIESLRAEVALLKKVRALMAEKEKRLHEIGRKPSKH